MPWFDFLEKKIEPKKVSSYDIITWAMKWSAEIAGELFKTWVKKLSDTKIWQVDRMAVDKIKQATKFATEHITKFQEWVSVARAELAKDVDIESVPNWFEDPARKIMRDIAMPATSIGAEYLQVIAHGADKMFWWMQKMGESMQAWEGIKTHTTHTMIAAPAAIV